MWERAVAAFLRASEAAKRPLTDSPPADVSAAEAARPVELVDCRIGAGLCLCDARSARGDAEHATAIGENARAIAPGAGVEDLNIRVGPRSIEALDLGALGVAAGIALRRHHH